MSGTPGRILKRALVLFGRTVALVIVLAVAAGVTAVWYFRHRAVQAPAANLGEVALPRGTRSIELYFPDDRGQELVPESREVVEDEVAGDALVRTVVEELLRGPESVNARAAFPEGSGLAHVYSDPEGGLYLDFNAAFRDRFRGGSTAEYLLLSSLVRTLSANVPNLSRVTVTASGQPLESLGGHVRLTRPLLVSEWR